MEPASQGQRPRSSGADLQSEKELECSGQRRLRRRVALRQPQRERVEQDVDDPRRSRAAGRGARGRGRLPHDAHAVGIARPDRRADRFEVRLTRVVGVERLQAPGCAEEQPRRVGDASLVKRDLSAQVLHLGGPQGVERAGLDRHQQSQGRVERAGIALRPGSRQQALRSASGLGRQHRRALEECGRRGQAPARLRAAGRALELLGDVLVGTRRGLSPVPGAAVGIDLRIGGVRKGALRVLPFLRRR